MNYHSPLTEEVPKEIRLQPEESEKIKIRVQLLNSAIKQLENKSVKH